MEGFAGLPVVFKLARVTLAVKLQFENPALVTGVKFSGNLRIRRVEKFGVFSMFPHCSEGVIGKVCAGLCQQLAQFSLGGGVASLADSVVAHLSLGVNQILSRPKGVQVVVPSYIIVVQGHRPGNTVVLGGLKDVGLVLLKLKLRRVDAQDYQPVVGVLVMPEFKLGEGADAVDAGISPEIQQHNPAAEVGQGQRFAVNPRRYARYFGCRRPGG